MADPSRRSGQRPPSGTVTPLVTDVATSAALEVRPHNLPVERSTLLGRERELAQAERLLLRDDVGLLTLTGAGGTGKTRLAVQVAAELLDRFEDGAFFVALAPVADSRLVASAIAQALAVRETGDRSLVERLQDHLRDKLLLLVLDNFEQVLPAASLVSELLVTAPRLKVLATSREALRVRGEHELPVPPLALPDADAPPSFATLAHYPATTLFVERATAIRPDFALTEESAVAVVEICRRLDGLPLAIELAAARCRLLSPMAVLGRLEHRLTLLTGGPRDLPARQQALRDTIGWSYDLLDISEQRLFRRLAVFVGGFALEAAEAIGDPDGELGDGVFNGVASLAAKSLLTQAEQGGEPRFGMLETIREYAAEQLEASGEAAVCRRRHVAHFLALAERAEPEIWGADVRLWVERLEREHDNLRTALDWCLATDVASGLRLTGSLWRFWERRGYLTEGRSWLERMLVRTEVPTERPTMALAGSLLGAAYLARDQGDVATARSRFEQSLTVFRAVGDSWGIGSALRGLGLLAQAAGDRGRARALFQEAVSLFRDTGHTVDIGWTLRNLGILAQTEGDYVGANTLFEESLPILRQRGIKTGTGRVLGSLGILARIRGDLGRARALLEESHDLLLEAGDKRGVSMALGALGSLARIEGDRAGARAMFEQSLRLGREMGDNSCIAHDLGMMGVMTARQGAHAHGVRLIGAATAIHPLLRTSLEPDERADVDAVLTEVKAVLGAEAFAVAWAHGQWMTVDEAIAQALAPDAAAEAGRGSVARTRQPRRNRLPGGLTEREGQVLRLVALGKTNREIAADLALSEYTVMRHLSNIFQKIGVSSRTAAASFAVREGIC